MGKVKEWLMTEHECLLCGKLKLPDPRYSELEYPICSEECWMEFVSIMNANSDYECIEEYIEITHKYDDQEEK